MNYISPNNQQLVIDLMNIYRFLTFQIEKYRKLCPIWQHSIVVLRALFFSQSERRRTENIYSVKLFKAKEFNHICVFCNKKQIPQKSYRVCQCLFFSFVAPELWKYEIAKEHHNSLQVSQEKSIYLQRKEKGSVSKGKK